MLKRLGLAGLGVLGLVVLCVGGVFLLIHSYDPPADWRNPPLYVGAQNVNVQDFGEKGKPQLSSGTPRFLFKIITFTVADPPDKVLTYYRNVFNGSHWRDGNVGSRVTDPGQISRVWSNGLQRSPADYLVDVINLPSISGGSDVRIEVSMIPGY
jgi:hypothetical protein